MIPRHLLILDNAVYPDIYPPVDHWSPHVPDTFRITVVRKDEPRQALRPLRASAREAEIVVAERADVAPLKAVPVDYLQREHAADNKDGDAEVV